MVWLDKAQNHRIYYDLDEQETRWLGGIAKAFGLTIPAFARAFYNNELPLPAPFVKRPGTGAEREEANYAKFTVTCSDPATWRQLTEIAKHEGHTDAQRVCLDAILGNLEMYNEDLVFDPVTGAVLAENCDIYKLGFRTNTEGEPPPDRRRSWVRGESLRAMEKERKIVPVDFREQEADELMQVS